MHDDWKPSADISTLHHRAVLLDKTRDFFNANGYLEVETPLLSREMNPAPYLAHLSTQVSNADCDRFYLQTSPEFHMKRLLAAGSGPIYQLCKAFRDGEHGSLHNPEFTMLEWYRPGINHFALMDEVNALLQSVFAFPPAQIISYRDCFLEQLNLDPFDCEAQTLQAIIAKHGLNIVGEISDLTTLLELIIDNIILPLLSHDAPLFLYHYPSSQAQLAKMSDDGKYAERFEVYYRGVELGNGYHELNDYNEQKRRLAHAETKHYQRFLDSIQFLPDCSGIALGFDRLVSLSCNMQDIRKSISFDFQCA